MNATVKLEQSMAFTGKADTGFSVQMDSSPSTGGHDSGFRPMELLLVGLGGCTAMDVLSILRKKRQEVTGLEIELEAEQAADHPHVFTNILVKYIVHGKQINSAAVDRAIELSVTKYCPAQKMFESVTTINHTYEIIEED